MPATWEGKLGGSRFQASLGKMLVRPHLNQQTNKLGMVVHVCDSYGETQVGES
jgi:hypothetical protein